jgi:hypothetical protein
MLEIKFPFQPSMFTHFGRVACFEREGLRPHVWRTREELGRIWIPAPTWGYVSRIVRDERERERHFCDFRGGFEDCYGVAC